ncbi:MAG: phage tail tape measure protein, partial [Oscillospiraceae bacterium]|nr:phage tail tape measure protein [Oscillospiraceae bacterium]
MSGSIKGITIELSGDTKGLESALKTVTSQSVVLGKDLKTVNQLLKLDPGNAELVAQKQQILAQSVETTAQKLEILRAAQEQVKAQFESGTITREQYIAFQEELVRTESRMDSLKDAQKAMQSELDGTASHTKTLTQTVSEQEKELSELKAKYVDVAAAQGADSDEAQALSGQIKTLSGELKDNKGKLSDAEKEADHLDQTIDDLGDTEQETEGKTHKLGNALKNGLAVSAKAAAAALKASLAAIGAVSAAALKFAKDSVSVGMTFDASVSKIGATLGYTADQLSDRTSEASQNLQMLRNKAQEMGAATSFSATEAAEGLNILAMSGYSAEESCSMINDVLSLAAAGSLSLAEAAAYTSGAVKGFADDTKDAQYYTDLMAKGATLANTDVKALGEAMSDGAATAASYGQNAEGLTLALLRMAEQGVTGTQATTSLNRAMADLYTPSAAAEKAMKQLGISAYDSAGTARDFNAVVDELNAALADMSDEEANAYKNTIFTSNGLQAFNKMTVTSTDKVNEWAEALADAAGSAGAQAETMLDNLQGDITIFGSAMEGAKIALSDSLTPALREFVQFGTDGISTLTDAFKSGGLSGAIAALGPILEGLIGNVSGMLPTVISVATELVTALASQLPTLLQAILPPLISGVQQVLTALVGQLPAIFRIISDSMPILLDAILSILPQIVEVGLQLLTQLALGIAQALPTLIPTIVDVVLQIVDTLIDNIDLLIDAGIQLIMGLA